MSCCGSRRQQVVSHAFTTPAKAAPAASVAHRPSPAGVHFVYDGLAGVVVTGLATGRRYRFGERGDRLLVDVRDAPSLAMIPQLRRIAP
jgi:hypothetical protein